MNGIFPFKINFSRSFLSASFLFILLLGLSSPIFAAISISTTVDKTDLSLADTIELSVRINGTQNAPSPAFPLYLTLKLKAWGLRPHFK